MYKLYLILNICGLVNVKYSTLAQMTSYVCIIERENIV